MAIPVEAQNLPAVDVPAMVRLALRMRGMSGTDIGPVIGVSQSGVSQRLRGKVPFRADELISLARFLRIEPGDFFRSPEELFRSRCFSVVANPASHLQLSLGFDRQLVGV